MIIMIEICLNVRNSFQLTEIAVRVRREAFMQNSDDEESTLYS